MSKLKNILKGIRTAQDILDTLDSVVDVDRLIGISNAQGPIAKNIRTAISTELDRLESDVIVQPQTKRLGSGRKKAPRKRKASSSL
jgi:hypothetical protein